MQDKVLREQVKILKARGIIKNYYELARYLNMSEKGFYNWLNAYYDLGYKRRSEMVNFIKEH